MSNSPNSGSGGHHPESTERLKRRISAEYESLPKNQKAVADFLVRSMQEAAFLSVVEIGERSGVSKATVVRFAQLPECASGGCAATLLGYSAV